MPAAKFIGKDLRYRDGVWLKQKYVHEEMSTIDIARLVHASHSTIIEWLAIHGIPTRDTTERYATARSRCKRFGASNPHWRGGEVLNGDGRIYIFNPGHPFAHKTGYVPRARLVVEKRIGRYLRQDEIVHHINRIVADDRDENLAVMSLSDHSRFHARETQKRIRNSKLCANPLPQ